LARALKPDNRKEEEDTQAFTDGRKITNRGESLEFTENVL
jgi:hypothetical protein